MFSDQTEVLDDIFETRPENIPSIWLVGMFIKRACFPQVSIFISSNNQASLF